MKKESSLADKILLAIKEMADISYDGVRKDSPIHDILNDFNKHTVTCTINRLKRNGYIEEIKVDSLTIYKLTAKGKVKIFRSYINHKPKWDGKWRLVIFDIPEAKKKQREIFRTRLRDLGFQRVQNSVWICPHDVQGVIKLLSEAYKLDEHVHLVIAEQVSGERKLIEKFELKF